MAPQRITVFTKNNDFQFIEVLKRNRRKRHRAQTFFVEGVKPLNLLLASGWPIKAFVYSPEKGLSNWAQDVLRKSSAQIHYELTPELIALLSDKEDPSELMALVQIPEDSFDRLLVPMDANPLFVVLDRPQNPGNIGTIIRSADAFRAHGLVITGHSADLYDPITVRSSIGTIFQLPAIRQPSPRELEPWITQLKQRFPDLQVVGSSARADCDVVQADLANPTILILGNETDGLSNSFRELCDTIVRIPIYGAASSLNVACAASVLLYEIDRQRRL